MSETPRVTVELYGVPRLRAGRAELRVAASTVAEALAALVRECPALAGVVQIGRLDPHYLLSVNGRRFGADLSQRLESGDRLLLLSADAGG